MGNNYGRIHRGVIGDGSALGQKGIWIPRAESEGPYDFGNALLFDGSNDYLVSSPATDTDITGDFIISFWFKSTLSGGSASSQFVATVASEADYLLMANANRVRIRVNGTVYDQSYSWSTDSDWHHYCYYRTSGNIYLVIDGVDYGLQGNNTNVWSYRYIGRRGSSNTINLNGTLDDWYINQATVTLSQVQDIYNGGAGADPQSVVGGTPSQYLKFNESSPASTALADYGLDMNLTNFDTAVCWVTH